MIPEQDKEWQVLKVRAKAQFLSKLHHYHEHITDAINAREEIKNEINSVITISEAKWKYSLSAILQKPIDQFEVIDHKVLITTEEEDYLIDIGRVRQDFYIMFSSRAQAYSSLNLANLSDLIEIVSVVATAKNDANILLRNYIIDKINQAHAENNNKEQNAWMNESSLVLRSFDLLSFKAYLSPCYGRFILENAVNLTPVADIQRAVSLFQAIDRQLQYNVSLKNNSLLLDRIIDETVSGLNGNLNIAQYSILINQIPLNRSWGRIIGFTCLAILAAALVVAATILAISSFGLATPLAVFGIIFAINYIVGGYALATGLLGLGLMCSSIFFAAKGSKNEVAIKAEDYANNLIAPQDIGGGYEVGDDQVAPVAPVAPVAAVPVQAAEPIDEVEQLLDPRHQAAGILF